MSPWVSILTSVVVPFLAVAVNAVINMTIRFAPDEATATRRLKDFALRIIQWILNAGLIAVLLREVISSEPLTRLAVFAIALQVGVLILIVVFYMFNRLTRALEHAVRTAESQVRQRGNP
jgi:hypothetical protein